jgi:DNA repair protein RecN (Recombination protein N)
VLAELEIRNLAVIDHARIAFGPGLNVLTGETGAGKSIVIDALGLLAGGKADAGMVRAGASAARVEGFFSTEGLDADALRVLEDAGLLDAGEDGGDGELLILAREVSAAGRSVSRINGRAVPVRMLADLGERLIDIHGQSAHLSLLRVPEHVAMLDRWASLADRRREVQELQTRLRRLQRDLAALRGDARELARRADLLRHQVEEIAAARLEPGEEEALRAEQRIQANAEQIIQLAGGAYEAVAGGGEEASSARDLVTTAGRLLGQLHGFDPGVAPQLELLRTIDAQLEELAAGLRAYRDRVDYDPERLAAIDDRLGAIFALKRKYGGSVDEVLAFAAGAEAELRGLEGREGTIASLEAAEQELVAQLSARVVELTSLRRQAAGSLEQRVEEQLGSLAMSGRFGVRFGTEDPAPERGPGEEGGRPAELEPAEFLLSLNPGEPVRPLAKIASGGETSRVMLAIKAALAGADPHPTLVFDEIDTGIGGRVGEVVGVKLWELARHSQVLAVTHLPQLAAYGDVHLRVGKEVSGGRTVTRVERLEGPARVEELAEMFGSDPAAGRLQATALLERAARHAASVPPAAVPPAGDPAGDPAGQRAPGAE